jgi:Na+/proline symporter
MLFFYYQHTPAPALGRTDEILPAFVVGGLTGGAAGFIVAAIVAAALSPSLNAMAAATVNDFYRRYWRPDADDGALLRVARRATIVWGVVQVAVAIGAQWMQRSVLDNGLAVLSLASGPVLGAFLVGVLSSRVGTGAMLAGMAAGIVVLTVVWASGAVAWTWYAALGAGVTSLVALAAQPLVQAARRS